MSKEESSEPKNTNALKIASVGDMCPSHKPKHENDYIGWHLWAEKQSAKGIEQKKCEKCERWFFPSEF